MFCPLLSGIVLLGLTVVWGTERKTIIVMLVDNGTYVDGISRDWSSFLSTTTADIVVNTLGDSDARVKDLAKLCETFGQGPAVVVDTTEDCTFANIASEFASLYLRVSHRLCTSVNIVNVRPSLEFYVAAVWNYTRQTSSLTARTVFLYDPIFGKEEVLISTSVPRDIPAIMCRPLASDDKFRNWITRLFTTDAVHFVTIVGRKASLYKFFEEACDLGIPHTFRWTVVVTDATDFNWTRCNINPLTLISHRQPSWTRSSTNNSEQVTIPEAFLLKAVKIALNLTGNWKRTRRVGSGPSQASVPNNSLLNDQRQMNLEAFGDIIEGQSEEEFPTALGVINIRYINGSRIPVQAGQWRLDTGITWYNWSRPGWLRYKLAVVTMHEPPFVIRHVGENGTRYTGYAFDVLDEVARRLSLDYTVYEPRDGQFGKMRKDGTWTGLVGDIVAGYADMIVAPLSVTTERVRVVDFTTPFYYFGGIQILIKSNVPSSSFLAFTSVFTQEVWACWASVLVLTGVLVCAFERLSPHGNRKDGSQRHFTLKESMWLVTASLTMAGPESIPRTFSSRMMVGGFWFFCSITMATYTANLAAFLTTSRLNVPIESLDDLAKQSAIKYSVIKGTVMHDYFERMASIESSLYQQWKSMSFGSMGSDSSTILPPNYAVWDYPLGDTYMTIWNSIQRTGLINNSQEGFDKVLKENFAFIHESPMVQYEVSRRCDLMAIGKQFSVKPYAFALPKESPLTKIISHTILEMQSQTVLETLRAKWWKNSSVLCSEVDESRGLTFHSVGGIFVLVAGGMALGIISLVLERFWSSFKGTSKANRTTGEKSRTGETSNVHLELDNTGMSYLTHEYDKNTLEMARMY